VWAIYLVIVELSGDADRKRLDYMMEKWEGLLKLRKLCSGVFIVAGSSADVIKFFDDLLSRFSGDKVEIFKLSEPDISLEPLTLEALYEVTHLTGDVWSVIDFIMAKLKGALISSVGTSRTYRVKGRPGEVEVSFSLYERDGRRLVKVEVRGYGKAVPSVFNKISNELSYVGVVKHE